MSAIIGTDRSSLLHTLGIYFFAKGFLLTRLVLENKSECGVPPITSQTHQNGAYYHGCWHPKAFEKAVVVVVDALRYDFTVPFQGQPHYFHNALRVLHETASETPQNAFLLPFIADPPTTTLQRLKGLTTGTLPTFIDAGSNFAGTAIEEDNLLAQLRAGGKNLVHLGDDTWQSLFPGYFDPNLSHAYDSFNVWDLHTVDNGVSEHLLPLLNSVNATKWDIVFAHYLGVDHAGHRYGPDHQAMAAKLRQMDDVFRELIRAIDDQTLLVVMGDHGMDAKGDHGGESDDEVEAALWMFSKKGIFGRSHTNFTKPPKTAKERPVGQIDLVPTLSLLLGMPIPFNNLGAPIEEAFIGSAGHDWPNLAAVNALTAAQIKGYQHEYAFARGLEQNVFARSIALWGDAQSLWQRVVASPKADAQLVKASSSAFSDYQKETLRVCRSLWARFDVPSMIRGIAILLLAVLSLGLYARLFIGTRSEKTAGLLQPIAVGSAVGATVLVLLSFVLRPLPILDGFLLGTAIGGVIAFLVASWNLSYISTAPLPKSLWGWLALLFTLSQSIGFASNSYTIWEDEILLFFLSTFALSSFISSLRQIDVTDRFLGMYQSLLFLLLTRVASLSRLCREEQMPFCRSTYYASATSSTSAPWQLLIPYVLAILLPSVVKSYYHGTRSYEGSAIFWIGFALRTGLLGSAFFWTLDAADDGDWFSMQHDTLKTIKTLVAQMVLAVAFAAGTTTFIWAKPCVHVDVISVPSSAQGTNSVAKPETVTILGYANVHGSRYFLLFSNWLLALILLQKPMGGGAISILAWQVLTLLEIIDTNDLSQSAIGPIVLGLLGNFHFFKTGHQATLASIQWESAFIPLKTIRYPWSPLLVVLNTFGAQILTAIAVPLVVLWKQPPKKNELLSDVAKAMATHLSYYAAINVATTMWAGWLRRHLMLYRIFSPRFLTGAGVLLIVDLVGIFVAIGGVRPNILSVAEVFGWE
ncbi:mannose-ethanolamine phosphotransferase gpi13 [Lignoscripta atroalba]|nr:mannose-ethanolamine phosphotransferase gpi13 [Lignoscripta atroalba]